jgi:hypothetical protein
MSHWIQIQEGQNWQQKEKKMKNLLMLGPLADLSS